MKTAIEWLQDTWLNYPDLCSYDKIQEWFQQAKKIEKEQMCKFAYKCHNHYKVYGDFKIEQYYNETFKSE